MSASYPKEFEDIVKSFHDEKHVSTQPFWPIPGKSGAYVALVDASGAHEGTYVLKADSIASGYDDEETCHRRALKSQAFRKHVPDIVASHQHKGKYLLLLRLAGDSRLKWVPLGNSPGLWASAYKLLAGILWSANLVRLGKRTTARSLLDDWLGYRLQAGKGRILDNVRRFFGREFLKVPDIGFLDSLLPNPLYFAGSGFEAGELRPLYGPMHGDCHSYNVMVSTNIKGEARDLYLIDLTSFRLNAPFFYDHAYFELATLLREFREVGESRWRDLSVMLASAVVTPIDRREDLESLNPAERTWAWDIAQGRKVAFQKLQTSYRDSYDDSRLQFLLAQVSAGLAFLNKKPAVRPGSSSTGLSPEQYLQALVWASAYLKKYLEFANVEMPKGEILSIGVQHKPASQPITVDQLKSVGGFDTSGLNILVLCPTIRENTDIQPLLRLPWSLVLDFTTSGLSDQFREAVEKPITETWPGRKDLELRPSESGILWCFINGREDISDASPSANPREWRTKYGAWVVEVLTTFNTHLAPNSTRALVLGEPDGAPLRTLAESFESVFGERLEPIFVVPASAQDLGDVRCVSGDLTSLLEQIALRREPSQLGGALPALVPRRTPTGIVLEEVPRETVAKWEQDIELVHVNLALTTSTDRQFGTDFRRGMEIAWSELARNLDVPRPARLTYFSERIREALEKRRNSTINLLHEPSAGGTTLGRRIAWSLKEETPTVVLRRISDDTSDYVNELFHYTGGLPVLVLMESEIVNETQREQFLKELRERNARCCFLWVSRVYDLSGADEILPGELTDDEAEAFLKLYSECVTDESRKQELSKLAHHSSYREQRSPFFFGLTAFGEDYLGLSKLVEDALHYANNDDAKQLLTDLALCSYYYSKGFPRNEFDELCKRVNGGRRPFPERSPLALVASGHVRIPHNLIARRVLSGLARAATNWEADLYTFADRLLDHLAKLENSSSDRLLRMIDIMFVVRDITAALEEDLKAQEQVSVRREHTRFSPLITDMGNSEHARALLKRLTIVWPMQLHYAVHHARHLLYEDPQEVEEAIKVAKAIADSPEGQKDDTVIHNLGMCHRFRMVERLREARRERLALKDVVDDVRRDFDEASRLFLVSSSLNPLSEYGHVTLIQTVTTLLSDAMSLTGSESLSVLLAEPTNKWCINALAVGEEAVHALRDMPGRLSDRAELVTRKWGLIYGTPDKVDLAVQELSQLDALHSDSETRRALCFAIIAKHERDWAKIPQAELRRIVDKMQRNIRERGAREADIEYWLAAYRRLPEFDLRTAIGLFEEWHRLTPRAVRPPFYLYVFYFVSWLNSDRRTGGYAEESEKWRSLCSNLRPVGARAWCVEWLTRPPAGYRTEHFRDLGFDPVHALRENVDEAKVQRLPRLDGTIIKYAPQIALLDLKKNVTIRFRPLDRIAKEHVGRRASVIVGFDYDGPLGWDPQLVKSSS